MRDYKAGDRFEIEIEETVDMNYEPCRLYKIKGFNSLVFDDNGLDKLNLVCPSVQETEAYKQGMNDMLAAIKRVWDMSCNERQTLFNLQYMESIIKNYDVLEIKNKIAEYEKHDIRVGDVVTVDDGDILFACTKDNSSNDFSKCHLIASDGSVWEGCEKTRCCKIGDHIEINKILEELKGVYVKRIFNNGYDREL